MIEAHRLTLRMKWVGLSGLVIVWSIMVYVNVIAVPPPQEVPLTYKSGEAAPVTKQDNPADRWEVHSLQPPVRELPGTPAKNIFAATTLARARSSPARAAALQPKQQASAAATPVRASRVPAARPPPSPEELARQQEALAAQAARQQEELQRQRLQQQMAQYRYLGYVNQNGIQKAFLGKGHDIHILRQGDTLDGQFVVVSMDATTVKIAESASKREVVLTLTKEGPSS